MTECGSGARSNAGILEIERRSGVGMPALRTARRVTLPTSDPIPAADEHPQHHGPGISLTHKAESRKIWVRNKEFLSSHPIGNSNETRRARKALSIVHPITSPGRFIELFFTLSFLRVPLALRVLRD
jgi:hypothetical protein